MNPVQAAYDTAAAEYAEKFFHELAAEHPSHRAYVFARKVDAGTPGQRGRSVP